LFVREGIAPVWVFFLTSPGRGRDGFSLNSEAWLSEVHKKGCSQNRRRRQQQYASDWHNQCQGWSWTAWGIKEYST
jgi:hypothetical protein